MNSQYFCDLFPNFFSWGVNTQDSKCKVPILHLNCEWHITVARQLSFARLRAKLWVTVYNLEYLILHLNDFASSNPYFIGELLYVDCIYTLPCDTVNLNVKVLPLQYPLLEWFLKSSYGSFFQKLNFVVFVFLGHFKKENIFEYKI